MGRFRLIATDLDDTLLDDNLQISSRTRRVLNIAAEKGSVVTIATGRMYRSACPVALDLGIEVPIITYQGALVKNACSGEVLAETPLPLSLAGEVLAEGYRASVHMNLYFDDCLYVDSLTAAGTGYALLAGVKQHPVGSLVQYLGAARVDPTKILYIAEPELLDSLKGDLEAKFGDSLYITKSKPNYLEFMHPLATKKHALENLARSFDISREEIIVFGDSYNDLDMIEWAGMGVAMRNAPAEVRGKADYVTDTNNRDGVAKALERFLEY
ncbi:Cof-type HAD-IIB family hydrolase [Phosphitispora fastidiosa]|uniref:Cof-type HAD-IIB family hydrolase n=1 Tax=Phosphitispora fastidiosa TaxID=2837202 RepID=UPI001E524756|nr:Cof subfamily protein (haloacid dehalogenase superfamily) [Phosphitispora fastidiosa]